MSVEIPTETPSESGAPAAPTRRRLKEPEPRRTLRSRLWVPRSAGSGRAPRPKESARAAARRERDRARSRMVGMTLAIAAGLCFTFVLTLSYLGGLKESRDQLTAYDNFRYELANGTAPVSQRDFEGQLVVPGTSVALLQIPALGLDAVVNEGTTSGVLQSGPGHRRDSVLPGQEGVSVVYGRRAAFGGVFAELGSLQKGDVITAVTGQGTSTYEVVGVRRAGDPVPPLAADGRLVLITADGRPYLPDGLLVVDADLTTEALPADPKVFGASALAASEDALVGDDTAWFGLLLWAQLLLVVSVMAVIAWAAWGRWEAWLLALPVVLAVGVAVSAQAAQLLPNLM